MRCTLYGRLLLILILCLVQNRSQAQQESVYSLKWITNRGSTLPLVQATLGDGKPRLFLVDTGTPANLIDRAVARELKLTPTTATNEGVTFDYVTPPFNLGPDVLPLSILPFDLSDLSFARQSIPELAGILGLNFLFNFTVRLDYPNQRMDLLLGSAAGTSFEPKDSVRLPLKILDRKYCVEADLDGHTAPFILDTGAENLFSRSPDLVKSLKPRAVLSGAHTIVATDSGLETKAADNRMLRLHRFRLGEITLDKPVIEQTLVDTRHPCNGLGNHFLERFHVVIDFPAHLLYLTPDPAYKEDTQAWIGTGLVWGIYDGRVIVDTVYSPSPASAAGLAEGDEITGCDGKSLAGMSPTEIADLLKAKNKLGETVHLEIKPISHLPTRSVKLRVKSLL